MCVIMGKPDVRRHRAGEGAFDRFYGAALEPAELGGGKIAGDPFDAHRVGTVRQQVDLDDRVSEPEPGGETLPRRRGFRQFENAFGVFAEAEFGARTQHSMRLDAADDALAERHLLGRDESARRREDGLQPFPRIRRAADDLHQGAAADVDATYLKAVGVGVRPRLNDAGDDEILKRCRGIVDTFDFEAYSRQRRDDFA